MKLSNKKILVIGPLLHNWSEIENISKFLEFLKPNYTLTFLDPIFNSANNFSQEFFYQYWFDTLQKINIEYDAFLGFSFGGIIFQQCIKLFEELKKPLIFFSAPSFIDKSINIKLTKIVKMIEAKKIKKAIHYLSRCVMYPSKPSLENIIINHFDEKESALRLLTGLKIILNTDSRPALMKTTVSYTNLIGSHSYLVNCKNIVETSSGKIILIPNSGMRMLQDNFPYCINIIKGIL